MTLNILNIPWNRSHLEHAIIGVVGQAGIAGMLYLITLSLVPLAPHLLAFLCLSIGGAIMCSIFLGREISQHEYYHLLVVLGWKYGGRRPYMPPLLGLYKHWDTDSILDTIAPILSTSALTGIVMLLFLL